MTLPDRNAACDPHDSMLFSNHMSRMRTWLIPILAVVSGLIIALVILFTRPMLYSGLIVSGIRATTGLQVSFAELEVDMFPPRITGGDIAVYNPVTTFSKPLLAIDQCSLQLDTSHLTGKATGLWSAAASGVVIRTGQDDNGQNLWPRTAGRSRSQDRRLQQIDVPLWFNPDTLRIAGFVYQPVAGTDLQPLQVANLSLTHAADERLHVSLEAS